MRSLKITLLLTGICLTLLAVTTVENQSKETNIEKQQNVELADKGKKKDVPSNQ